MVGTNLAHQVAKFKFEIKQKDCENQNLNKDGRPIAIKSNLEKPMTNVSECHLSEEKNRDGRRQFLKIESDRVVTRDLLFSKRNEGAPPRINF